MSVSCRKNTNFLGVLSLFILILFIFHFPNYYAYKSTPSDKIFSGQAFFFDPWDINVYVAAINWSQKNALYFQNAYTTEYHQPVLFYPFYTFLGILFPKTNPFLIFHLSSFVLGSLLLIIIFGLIKVFVPKGSSVLGALFLIVLGGGFGWIVYPKIISPDIALTPFTFTGTFQRPHEILAMSLYILSLLFFYLGVNKLPRPKKPRYSPPLSGVKQACSPSLTWFTASIHPPSQTRRFSVSLNKKKLLMVIVSSFLCNLLVFFYPFYFLSYYIICGGYALIVFLKRKGVSPILNFVIAFSTTFPVGLFYSWYLLSSKSFENVLSPNLSVPSLIELLSGYGILTIALLYQLFQKKKDTASIFLNLWFFGSLFLTYLPFPFARYYLRGLFFPLVLLSLKSLYPISKKLKVSAKTLLTCLIVIVPITNFYIFINRIFAANEPSNRWSYVSQGVADAFDYLNENTTIGSGVLSSYIIGNQIPTHTHNRVYFGHYLQTPNSEEKIENLTKFYANELSEKEAVTFLEKNQIAYIYWGEDEKKITAYHSDDISLTYSFLEPVFTNPSVVIYTYSH